MADSFGLGAMPGAGSANLLDRQADALLGQFGPRKGVAYGKASGAPTGGTGAAIGAGNSEAAKSRLENGKIDKSAKDFESILLGTWLQQAEQSFAKAPGGDDEDEDGDAGGDQLQGMAVQSLAGSLAGSGGIGIGRMISEQLHRAQPASVPGEGIDKPGKV